VVVCERKYLRNVKSSTEKQQLRNTNKERNNQTRREIKGKGRETEKGRYLSVVSGIFLFLFHIRAALATPSPSLLLDRTWAVLQVPFAISIQNETENHSLISELSNPSV
jgi:hypothetical protein